MEDKIAIQEVMARYNFAIDFGDIEAYMDCFTEDGGFTNIFGSCKGHNALRQYITERTRERPGHPLRHMMLNPIIDVHGDQASAKSYFLLFRVVPEPIQLLTTGCYKDELYKKGGAWRFSHRQVEFDSTAWARQVFPSSYLGKEI